MEEQIRKFCVALNKETESVIDYTRLINATEKEEHKRSFEIIRLDAVEHIQQLILELTKMIISEPTEDEKEEQHGA